MNVVVIGAGMAAARFAEQLTDRDVTLFGDEPQAPYNRVLLAEVLSGRYRAADIALPTRRNVTVRTGTEVVGVDTAAQKVTLSDGEVAGYDALVFATGALPVLPPIRNLHCTSNTGEGGELKEGVHAFRTLADCARLAEDAGKAKQAVVIGGGVLGVSAARALAALGVPVEIVHQAPHLMDRQLDEQGGRTLQAELKKLGVTTYVDNRARAVRGDNKVTGVQLASGYVLDADLVVLACGARPRTGLARQAGLTVRTGIVVDDTLQTSVPGVYAIGDCAEHRSTVHGLSGPAWEQADVLAAQLSGVNSLYTGSRSLHRLTAGPLEVAAFGDVHGGDAEAVRISDPTRGSYRLLRFRDDRIVGAVLIGDLGNVGPLTHAFERDEPVPAEPLNLLIPQGV